MTPLDDDDQPPPAPLDSYAEDITAEPVHRGAPKPKPKPGEPPDDGVPPVADGKSVEERAGPCPVTCLGRRKGNYFFLTPAGEEMALHRRDLTEVGLTSLFDGNEIWPRKAFPVHGRGDNAPVIGFDTQGLRAWLISRCVARGFFDMSTGLRGPGVWRGSKNRLILHLGDAVWVVDEEGREARHDAGLSLDGVVYPAGKREPDIADRPCTAFDAQMIYELLGRWNWRAPVEAPRLLLGFLVSMFYCGALKWRPHVWVTGDWGYGKSALESIMHALMGSSALRASDPSAAYVRQLLRGAARPLLLDEVEPSEAHTRAKDLTELARLASTSSQASTGRGGAAHDPTEFAIVASIYFTSIMHPPFKPQDMSRITVLQLGELPPDPKGEAKAAVETGLAALPALAPRWRRRLIDAWPRLLATIRVYDKALLKLNKKYRFADQFGTLLACADVALNDRVPDQEVVDAFVAQFNTAAFTERAASSTNWQQAIRHLLTHAVEHWSGGRRKVMSEIIRAATDWNTGSDQREELQAYGLRVERYFNKPQDDGEFDGPWLVVAYEHNGLSDLFEGTRWADGLWSQAFEGMPGVRVGGRSVRFSGLDPQKGMWLPLKDLMAKADDEEEG